ncbi:30S ribosome-binding factor RbfA [Bifidobacterium sp.]|uniref:30S ribosome-binding factor RbfA n=1 Tax=Bifidobacterium sp. TaxID=41200 RepID=UPI0025C2D60A|nr:30S ribosome-binding factor RbfA [Bifidobacterium sp.]MCI1635321.1 30S ribosome-binding factor RbfA [Bifidobacterium sp.]
MAGTNPRAVRIAALIQRVIASSVESHLHDSRLNGITITEVRVTNDLQIANVYWTILGHEGHQEGERKRAQQALHQAKGRLRTLVGSKAGLRLTPQLRFIYDEVPGEATEIEDILTVTRRRDAELAQLRENATFAGEADPYKHDDDEADTAEADAVEADTTAVVDDDTTTVAEPTPSAAQTASEVEEAETTPDINHDGE